VTSETLTAGAARRSRLVSYSAFAFFLLVANLRPPLTAVGPLLEVIRSSLGLSSAAAGLLPTLPLLIFAGFSPFARLGDTFGIERTLASCLALVVAGVALRSEGGGGRLFDDGLVPVGPFYRTRFRRALAVRLRRFVRDHFYLGVRAHRHAHEEPSARRLALNDVAGDGLSDRGRGAGGLRVAPRHRHGVDDADAEPGGGCGYSGCCWTWSRPARATVTSQGLPSRQPKTRSPRG
jgi:hypothetical protein